MANQGAYDLRSSFCCMGAPVCGAAFLCSLLGTREGFSGGASNGDALAEAENGLLAEEAIV